MEINWGALQGGGFQGALAQGLQLGQYARQQKDQRTERNALAAYAKNPNEANFGALADIRPDIAIGERQRMEQQRKAALDERNRQLGTFRQLLTAAGDNPQQAFAAAQGMGIDLSGIPQPGTAEFEPWRQEQLFIVDALSDPEKLDQIDRDLKRLGYTPETPGYEQAARELILFSRGKQGTDEYGRPVYDLPNIATPGQQQGVSQAPPSQVRAVPPETFRNDVASLGLQKAINFAVSKGEAVPITGDQEYALLPPGAAFVGPDGLMRRKP